MLQQHININDHKTHDKRHLDVMDIDNFKTETVGTEEIKENLGV